MPTIPQSTFFNELKLSDANAIFKTKKYVDPVPTYCAVICLELHNSNPNPNSGFDILDWK